LKPTPPGAVAPPAPGGRAGGIGAGPAAPGGDGTIRLAPGQAGGLIGSPPIACDGVQRVPVPGYVTDDPNYPKYGDPGIGVLGTEDALPFRGFPTRSVDQDGNVTWSCPVGSRLGFNPEDPIAQCNAPGSVACYGWAPEGIPTLPGQPGEPIPTLPETPEVPCVKICGLDELIEALKPKEGEEQPAECPKWRAYKDVETGECYVIKADAKPRNSDDKLLIESGDAAAIVAAVNRECGPKPERRPERPAEQPLGFGRGPAACDWILPTTSAEIANWPNPFGWMVGVTDEKGQAPPDAAAGGFSLFGQAVARFFRGTIGYGLENVWKVIRGFLANDPCFGGGTGQLAATRTVFNFLQRYFGAALEPAINPLTQHQNFLCPTLMPSAEDAARAYLGNTIDEKTARCWIRADGMRDTLYDRVIRASRSKLNPDQLVRLARRGVIPEGDLPERFRDLGFLDPSDSRELWELGKALPGPADVVRFMVRDVDDAKIVQKFGLDDEFGAKFAGLTAGYAKAAGIDEDLMRRYWRSHWGIPGPSQLLEMYHRLRNNPDVQGMRVDLETVETALQQQDILPYWIPRLLAVSFRPLRLVDVRRAFFDGSIGLEDVRRAYTDLGYSDTNAEILTRHLLKQKVLTLQKDPAVKAYAAGGLNSAELSVELGEKGFDQDQIGYAVQLARHKMSQAKRRACSKGVQKRLMRGEFDAQGAKERLIALGLDPDQAEWMADGWACERASKGKEFSAAQLCKMYDRGLISGPEMIYRLEQVGWRRDDAVRLFTLCAQDIDRARRMADIKSAREREKELEKARRQAEKDAKKIEQAAAQERNNLSRIDRLNKARNKAVIDAGAIWAKRQAVDLSDAIAQAKGVYRTVYQSTTAGQDVIISALLTSAKSEKVDTLTAWIAEATSIAESGVFSDPNEPPAIE
jgi:hypothetical protein